MLQANFTKPNPISKKTKYRPQPLFQNGADLPIFTRSPDVVPPGQTEAQEAQEAQNTYVQLPLFDTEAQRARRAVAI